MFKLTLMIALIAFGISKYNEKYNCTDDGCPDFHDEIEVPIPDENIRGDLREIEKDWKQAVVVPYREIELKYAVHKTVEKEYNLPEVDTTSNEKFVKSLNSCINYLYEYIQPEYHIPNELIIAQAVIETGWGKSRFANEGDFDCMLLAGRYTLLDQTALDEFFPIAKKNNIGIIFNHFN